MRRTDLTNDQDTLHLQQQPKPPLSGDLFFKILLISQPNFIKHEYLGPRESSRILELIFQGMQFIEFSQLLEQRSNKSKSIYRRPFPMPNYLTNIFDK